MRARLAYRPFLGRLLLWLVPSGLAWLLVLPAYNLFLTTATENLVRLTERPSVTSLHPTERHYFLILRTGVTGPARGGTAGSVRVTDTHFPVIFMAALFLAVPGLPLRQRLANLGWALLLSVFFHLLSLLFWVKFVYATQLGDWSLQHYGPFARNFWGLGKHLLDLPFKFALPLILWSFFHLSLLLPEQEAPE